jgi:phosphatidate cytidylyltransferase
MADGKPDDADHVKVVVGGRNLLVAIAVGLGLAGVFLGSLFWDPLAFAVVVAVVATLAILESARVLRGVGERPIVPVLVLASLLMIGGSYYVGNRGQVVGVAVLLLGSFVWPMADEHRHDVVRQIGTTTFLGLWIGLLASYAVLLVDRPGGPVVVLAVIGAAVLTDIGGYAFGVTLGRHKVAPSVSPNKSWEGLIGGIAVAVALAAGVLPLLGDTFTPASAALLAGVCGAASFIGDLAESMVKRDLGIKDLGSLLPGHGGILDRVDGILLALPVGYLVMELSG